MDIEQKYKETQKSLDKELETLKSQLELARLVEATRESESMEIASQLVASMNPLLMRNLTLLR